MECHEVCELFFCRIAGSASERGGRGAGLRSRGAGCDTPKEWEMWMRTDIVPLRDKGERGRSPQGDPSYIQSVGEEYVRRMKWNTNQRHALWHHIPLPKSDSED